MRDQLRRVYRKVRHSPAVTIIIPVFDVEDYVAECLDSVLAQAFPDFEAVVVDDGSRDGSMAIVEAYAMHDERIRVIHQANAGLGAARNAGLKAARGNSVIFVDSDDVLLPGALQVLHGSLERTGSDFAVAAIVRNRGERRHVPWWSSVLHRVERPAITIEDFPEILQDVYAGNKLYRRAFLKRIGFEYPAGTLYEDQIPNARCYLTARTFDVLTDIVYWWRLRESGDSITQNMREVSNLRQRMAAINNVDALLRAESTPQVRAAWLDQRIVGSDLPLLARGLSEDNAAELWSLLQPWAQQLLADFAWGTTTRVPVRRRMTSWAVCHSTHADVVALRDALLDEGRAFDVEQEGGTWRQAAVTGWAPGSSMPAGVRDLGQADVKASLVARRCSIDSRGQVTLELSGRLSPLPARAVTLTVNATAVTRNGSARSLEVQRLSGRDESTEVAFALDAAHDLHDAVRLQLSGDVREVSVTGAFSAGGLSASVPWEAGKVGTTGAVIPATVVGSAVWSLRSDPFRLAGRVAKARLVTVEQRPGMSMRIAVWTALPSDLDLVVGGTRCAATPGQEDASGPGVRWFDVSVPEREGGEPAATRLELIGSDGARQPVMWGAADADEFVLPGWGAVIRKTPTGVAVLDEAATVVIDGIEVLDGCLVVSGRQTAGPGPLALSLEIPAESFSLPMTVNQQDELYAAGVPLAGLRPGSLRLLAGGDGAPGILTSGLVARSLPLGFDTENWRIHPLRTSGGGLRFEVRAAR